MSEYYYLVAAIAYGLFIVQFALSWIVGDTDLDVDFDGDADMDTSDIFSFKGLIHFLMGASGWLCLRDKFSGDVMWWDYLIAVACGIIFVIVLYYLYKLLMKLEQKPELLSGKELVNRKATIYLPLGKDKDGNYLYAITAENNLGTIELTAKSSNEYHTGDLVTILDFNEYHYII